MSSLVFPILPLIDREAGRSLGFNTTVLKMWSGKEVRLGRQVTADVGIQVRLALRTWRQAPAPWAAYNELALVKYFHATMVGSLDTFILDNSTGAYDPDGPQNATDLVVRFASDRLDFKRIVPGAWSIDLELAKVL